MNDNAKANNVNKNARKLLKQRRPDVNGYTVLRGIDLKVGAKVMLLDPTAPGISWMFEIVKEPTYRHGEWHVWTDTNDGRPEHERSLASMGIVPSASGNYCRLITTRS